jgi:hypothetical protein
MHCMCLFKSTISKHSIETYINRISSRPELHMVDVRWEEIRQHCSATLNDCMPYKTVKQMHICVRNLTKLGKYTYIYYMVTSIVKAYHGEHGPKVPIAPIAPQRA